MDPKNCLNLSNRAIEQVDSLTKKLHTMKQLAISISSTQERASRRKFKGEFSKELGLVGDILKTIDGLTTEMVKEKMTLDDDFLPAHERDPQTFPA